MLFFNGNLLLIAIVWAGLNEIIHFDTPADHFMDKYGLTWKIFIGLLSAPFIETFFNQWLLYKILIKYTSNHLVIIFISALLFGLGHSYSLNYMFITFISGILLMIAFIYWEGPGISKYMMTVIIHMIHNTLMLILSLIFK